jgi:hypothetical protein
LREGWKEKTEAQAEEGCRMHGSITMNKVRGNFHFSAGKSFSQGAAHIHDMSEFLRNKHQQNFMHTIHHLQFGSHEYNNQKQKRTKESKLANPLEEREWGNEQSNYIIKSRFSLSFILTHSSYLHI